MQDSLASSDVYRQEIDYRFFTDTEKLDRIIEEAYESYCGLQPFEKIEDYELKNKILRY